MLRDSANYLLHINGRKHNRMLGMSMRAERSTLEEVKVREMSIIQLQKRIAEGETKLKQQQALYEAVRSDRNLYSKNLIESQDEIAEMKRKFKIMNHQIEQLKVRFRVSVRAVSYTHLTLPTKA